MDLLLFFALPISTIILAIVWQKIIKSPILVALTAFAIYLIVTFAVYDASFLIYTLIYTILAFIAAWTQKIICETIMRNLVIRNITAQNINTDTLSANTIETNEENDANNNGNSCCNVNNRFYRRYR